MKKFRNIFIILLLVIVLTGCGNKKQEKTKPKEIEKKINTSETVNEIITNAFKVDYIVKSFGLPVENNSKPIEKNGKKWYKVDTGEFKTVSEIETLIDKTYEKSLAKEMKSKLNEKYLMIDNSMYTISSSECMLEFGYKDASSIINRLIKNVEKDKNKIKFKFNRKDYSLNKSGDNYLLEDTIFVCQ